MFVTSDIDLNTLFCADPFSAEGIIAKPYDIPIRALIARDVDGLLMAGRCISGDFIAHSSYRVTGDAAALGEAAGVAAAQAVRLGTPPAQVPFAVVKANLAPLPAD